MLTLKRITKQFSNTTAVSNLELTVQPGEIYGLLGANGAGKTTTFRMILGLYEPTEGEILWNNSKIKEDDTDLIGYLPEERSLMPKMTVRDQVIYLGILKGKKEVDLDKELDYWLEKFEITHYKNKKLKELSKGNQQKIQFIVAVIHKPKLLILDEPFTGLDPINLDLMKNEILNLKAQGTMIIFSSHRMEHIESLCDSLTIMTKGKDVLSGNLRAIKDSYNVRSVLIKGQLDQEFLMSLPHVESVKKINDEFEVCISDKQYIPDLFTHFTPLHRITKFLVCEPTLHDIFIEKVGEAYEE